MPVTESNLKEFFVLLYQANRAVNKHTLQLATEFQRLYHPRQLTLQAFA